MGLKNNEKYTATKHFRDRLLERYGVVDSQWKQYMRKIYGSLQLAEQKTANQHAFLAKNQKKSQYQHMAIYHSDVYHCYVVVDTKGFKLITIFDDPVYLEDELKKIIEGEAMEKVEKLTTEHDVVQIVAEQKSEDVIEDIDFDIHYEKYIEEEVEEALTEEDKEAAELLEFANKLKEERIVFERKNKFKYAQKVIQMNQQIFDDFIEAYEKTRDGKATIANLDKLTELYTLKELLDEVFPKTKLPVK